MSKVTFDGPTRIIDVNSGVTDINVKIDIYLEWKKWVQESDNSKWLAAFRAFGGDPTTVNQNAPSYFFLTNGWIVRVENLTLVVHDNLYSDDYPVPYLNINSTILSKNSDIPGIEGVNLSLTGITNTLSGITDSLSGISSSIDDLSFDVKHILGLVQQNYRLSGHVYDAEHRLTSVTIKIFNTKADCDLNINDFANYTMTAAYDINGLLIDYKVVKN
jgi:hypothetical protein